ncbi:MAG: glycosyltransferase family 4 protein [Gammaproteobacteria bacterium]|nr:glycosyltransferase family 4 protein [Gammaproteobacteria bacterium]
MRIAIVSNRFAPHIGGIETQVALLAGELTHRGHNVTVLTRRYERSLSAREIRNRIRVERFRPYGQGVLSKWLLNLSTFWRIVSRRPGFDCVLVTQFSATALGPALANAIRGTPLILVTAEAGEFSGAISSRSLGRIPGPLRFLLRRVLHGVRHWAYHRARFVVAISTALAREAEADGFPARCVVQIPNALDTDRFRPVSPDEKLALRAALGIPSDAQVVANVGRLVQGKGLPTLVDAWSRLARRHACALLIIIGAGAGPTSPLDMEARIRETVREAGIEEHVRLLGPRLDVERYLQASDVFVFPSEAEGFGIALVEAMSCALPVLCGRIPGAASDLVTEGEHGLKFETGDAASLASQIETLLDSGADRQRLGGAARKVVESRLGVGTVTDGYERLIRAAVARQTTAWVEGGVDETPPA